MRDFQLLKAVLVLYYTIFLNSLNSLNSENSDSKKGKQFCKYFNFYS